MVSIFRRKATAVAIGAVAFALLGGGIAVAAPNDSAKAPAEQPGAAAGAPGVGKADPGAQPPVSREEAERAEVALVPGTTAGLPPTAQTHFAVVEANGTLTRGFQVASAARLGVGQYQVVFRQDVRGSAFTATLGLSGTQYIPPPGEIAVVGRTGLNNAVFVQTYNSAGAPSDRSFHLAVHS